MIAKQRLSASVAPDLIRAAEEAVARGHAPRVSAWVSDAMRLKAAHDRRLLALAQFVADFEAEHGGIGEEELRRAGRRARARALPVRSGPEGARPRKRAHR
jgi:hypothetical protein